MMGWEWGWGGLENEDEWRSQVRGRWEEMEEAQADHQDPKRRVS